MREQLIKYGANVSSVDPSIFYWKGNSPLVGILECCIDDMIWGGDEMFQRNIIKKLKDIFRSRCEEIDTFTYTGIELVHDSDFSISINQNNCISSFTEIVPPIEQKKGKTISHLMKKIRCTEVQSITYTGLFVLQDLTLIFQRLKPVLNLKKHNKRCASRKQDNQKCKKYKLRYKVSTAQYGRFKTSTTYRY